MMRMKMGLSSQAVSAISSSKMEEFCNNGDDVCNGSGSFAITPAYITYGSNAKEAADLILSRTSVS